MIIKLWKEVKKLLNVDYTLFEYSFGFRFNLFMLYPFIDAPIL